jgi:transposase
VSELEALVLAQQKQLETQAIQITELQTMVFGKRRQPPAGGTPIAVTLPKSPRTKDSYRRSIPPTETITQEVVQPLPETCTCGGSFDPSSVTTHDRYEEDIPLPELTEGYQPKLVTKYVIERGICLACGKAASGRDLGGAQVSLGANVRLLVCHLISVGGMSYRQVVDLFAVLYGLALSKGEVANILQTRHQAWLPAYNQLRADIRSSPVVHADETPWTIQQENGGYAWVLADGCSPRVCYELAQSRGASIAKSLFGQGTTEPFVGIRVSDDYGPYRNPELPGTQQLCWVHLYRTIRDTRHNENLPEKQLPYVRQWYEAFAAIYQDLRQYLMEPYDEVVRVTQSQELWERVYDLAIQPPPLEGEPDKLTRLKAQLQRAGQDRLFVCLQKNTPCDNNRAERDLRQLVLKRKRSFGSQTERGAKALSTILSVCTTTWRTQSQGYFAALAAIGRV